MQNEKLIIITEGQISHEECFGNQEKQTEVCEINWVYPAPCQLIFKRAVKKILVTKALPY